MQNTHSTKKSIEREKIFANHVEIWIQSVCPSMDKWIRKIYRNSELLLSHKRMKSCLWQQNLYAQWNKPVPKRPIRNLPWCVASNTLSIKKESVLAKLNFVICLLFTALVYTFEEQCCFFCLFVCLLVCFVLFFLLLVHLFTW